MKTILAAVVLVGLSGCAAFSPEAQALRAAQRQADQPLEIACIQSGGNWDHWVRTCVRPTSFAPTYQTPERREVECETRQTTIVGLTPKYETVCK